jgi:beta-phosphoglucomutase-like phosphatase (HAD superfamily)/dTDP-glucose pyrophosphorylase
MNEKNKLVAFDLDGVLIDSREIHYIALNQALSEFNKNWKIDWEEHLAKYDGLPTTKKLELLSKTKGVPETVYNDIWKAKQKYTIEAYKALKLDYRLITCFHHLKCNLGFKIAVVSNSIRETMETAIKSIGIQPYVDIIISNQDVKNSKPHPEPYWQAMIASGSEPSTTLIVEDSHIGRQSAISSGAHLLPVENHKIINLKLLVEAVKKMNNIDVMTIPWRDPRLNVLIPMAGAGTRFAQAGFTFPKPLIEVRGKPMIQVVVENLNIQANYIFIVQKEHRAKYALDYMLNMIAPGCKIIETDGLTRGAACTTLLAKEYINNDNPLLIANSDQVVEWNSNEVMYQFIADPIDGGILTFSSTHPKWSYAKLNEAGFVTEVAEKKPISDQATVGIYYWKYGCEYVKAAEKMIAENDMVNGEFYVAPAFNYAIAKGSRIRVKQIPKMWGIGTPEDLQYFLDNYEGNI